MTHRDSEEKSKSCSEDEGVAGDPAAAAADSSSGLTIEQQLERARSEARENYDRFVRERAELENFKKRMQREKSEALKFATEPLLRDLLPVVDNLERALQHAPADDPLAEGLRFVMTSLMDALGRHGVAKVDATGQKFDPALHQAMAQVPVAGTEPNTVIEQHAAGYKLHDRLLRPAMVVVSAQKSDGPVETPGDSD